jgi:hypothetical protein
MDDFFYFSVNPKSLLDPKLTPRDAKGFEWMRSLEEIKKKVNQFVELPCLGNELPKDMEEKDIKQVLMTPERISLVEELWKTLSLGEEGVRRGKYGGMILSGPNGIGKSVDSYLLTSVAYMNGALVIYIVSCLLCLIYLQMFCSYLYFGFKIFQLKRFVFSLLHRNGLVDRK